MNSINIEILGEVALWIVCCWKMLNPKEYMIYWKKGVRKKEEDQWINGIPDGMTYMLEEMFIYVENGKQLQFSIPFYKENSNRELVQVENPLVKGHYKYVHYFQGCYSSQDQWNDPSHGLHYYYYLCWINWGFYFEVGN